MYFVVYLKAIQRNVVLPASWIDNIGDHFEKFVNNSINSNQSFLCYFTNNEDAFIDGRPSEDFVPNFRLPMVQQTNADDSFEGCFLGKLKKFKRSHDDAVAYLVRLRNIEPPTYNERRAIELPIPSFDEIEVNVSTDSHESFVSENDDTLNSIENAAVDGNDINIDAAIQIDAPTDPLATSIDEDRDTINSTEIAAVHGNDSNIDAAGQIDVPTDPLAVSVNEDGEALNSTEISAAPENYDNVDTVGQINASADPGDTFDNVNDRTQNSSEIAVTNGHNESALDSLSNNDENINIVGCNESATNSLANNGATKIERDWDLVPLYDIHVANNAEIEELFQGPKELPCDVVGAAENDADANADDDDDDVVMIVGPSGIPKPWSATIDQVFKRENDKMSGNIAFNQTGNGRAYRIGTKLIEIPNKAVEKIIEWNEGSQHHDITYDRKICHSLLLSLVAKEDLCVSKISSEVMQFIKDCFVIRCGETNADERMASIDGYTTEFCAKMGAAKPA